jgi:DNA-binding NarL/FixJ family response regulator
MSSRRRSESVRVFIVDDHPMLREGTQSSFERAPGIEVVGTASDGASALEQIAQQTPDVLVLDMRLPDMSGVDVARHVRSLFPSIGIVILTGYDDPHYARAVTQLDIQGYLRKTASSDEIVAAVRRVASGRKVFDPEIVRTLEDTTNTAESLTSRELEVLQLIARGRRNAEIADELTLSVKTVEMHISNMLAKMGSRSRSEAVRAAYQQGLLQDG